MSILTIAVLAAFPVAVYYLMFHLTKAVMTGYYRDTPEGRLYIITKAGEAVKEANRGRLTDAQMDAIIEQYMREEV